MVRRFVRRLWGQEPPSALKSANQMYTAGDYAGAAEGYAKLAPAAEKERSPHAAWLYLQAARSYISTGEVARSIKDLEHGLSLLISAGFDDKAYLLGHQFMAQFINLQKEDEAGELSEFLRFGLPGYTVSRVQQTAKTTQVLPMRCPSCEGPIRLVEVRWKDPHTAECPYCGDPVRVLEKARE